MQDTVNKDNFPQRLTAMIETHPECPQGTYGRLPFILAQLAKVTSNIVSPETVRKWLAGEAHPRRERVIALAEAFGADPAWLEHGYEKEARDAAAIPDRGTPRYALRRNFRDPIRWHSRGVGFSTRSPTYYRA
jgi:transcriptional regulator with XRE-family HTH domain